MPNIKKTARTPAVTTKIDELLALQKITLKDIEGLTKPECDQLGETAAATLATLTGEQRDAFVAKIDAIILPETKNSFWEHNHQAIGNAVAGYMRQYGTMPTKSAIAEDTGLSRQTVAKHFKEYRSHPEFTAELEQFKFMSHNLLASVFKFASEGNMKAARIFFEMVGAIGQQSRRCGVVNEQNNYIQINNTILSQENLKQLTAQQLSEIENLLNTQYKIV